MILRDNDALPSDFGTLILRIFKQTSCADFKSFVGLLEHNVELKLTKLSIEETLQLFETKYTDMLGRNEWTPKSVTLDQESVYTMSAERLPMLCFNCGGIGHGVSDCKLPIDQKAIDIRKKIVLGNRSKGGGNSSGSSSNDKKKGEKTNIAKNENKKEKGKGYSDPLKKPPGKNEAHEKIFNGKKLFWCGKEGCCQWGEHTSANHPSTNNVVNHIDKEDIGDDSSANPEAHFVTSTSLTGF